MSRGELAVLVGVASLLSTVQCDVGCGGTDGKVGEPGAPGRDGWPGVKGQKGEPVASASGPVDPVVLLRQRGEKGSRGPQGTMGPKGYAGDLGAAGRPGNPGPPGQPGKNIGHSQQASNQGARSAFSVIQTTSSHLPYRQKITYDNTVVNIPGDLDANTGIFTCRIPGAYYFTFNTVARVSLCLGIASDALDNKVVFCDYHKFNRNEQVLTGGLVLQLAQDQTVWLESVRDQQTEADGRDTREKKIFFNGFLLFSNAAGS
ncbi:complement C1q subcomponent subunit C-like isoform X2 [Cololabis saira]|uniref:complement C1q subcomponent subunit C-like isoform X2 n=1 Tax=Cololabis saira TaxID=129043 RepID=UPI002AD4AF04|nr:complement C1q subcomponent subunit C-like isoform X2 [Cololabis saira]